LKKNQGCHNTLLLLQSLKQKDSLMLTPYFQKCINTQIANLHELLKVLKTYFLDIELANGEKSLVDLFRNKDDFSLEKQEGEIFTFKSGQIKIIIDQEKWKNEVFFYNDAPENLVNYIKLTAQKANYSVYNFKLDYVTFSNNDSFFVTIYEMYKQEEVFFYSSNQKKVYQFLYRAFFIGSTNSIYFNAVKNILEENNPEEMIRARIKEYLNIIFVGDFLNTKTYNHSKDSRKPVHYSINQFNIKNISWVSNYHALLFRKERQKPSVFELTLDGKIKDYFYVMGLAGNHKKIKDFVIENDIPLTKNYDWPIDYIYLARMNNLFNND
jgi:hypothetical protein